MNRTLQTPDTHVADLLAAVREETLHRVMNQADHDALVDYLITFYPGDHNNPMLRWAVDAVIRAAYELGRRDEAREAQL